MKSFTLILSCAQRPGIVHAITGFLFEHGCDIVVHQQFDDKVRNRLFLRTEFTAAAHIDRTELAEAFGPVAEEFGMPFSVTGDRSPRVMVMVSKLGHCLNDLLFRWRSNNLGGELVAVVSNHLDLQQMAEDAGLP